MEVEGSCRGMVSQRRLTPALRTAGSTRADCTLRGGSSRDTRCASPSAGLERIASTFAYAKPRTMIGAGLPTRASPAPRLR
jgi:hypothetical protein